MKYRIITEYGDSWDGPWHVWIEHKEVIEFAREPTEDEVAFPLMEVEGIPVRMRYEAVAPAESVGGRTE